MSEMSGKARAAAVVRSRGWFSRIRPTLRPEGWILAGLAAVAGCGDPRISLQDFLEMQREPVAPVQPVMPA
ncbi:MAG TPA: hypothetical protein VGM03_01360, partial [Phycisphaerae bacterium]